MRVFWTELVIKKLVKLIFIKLVRLNTTRTKIKIGCHFNCFPYSCQIIFCTFLLEIYVTSLFLNILYSSHNFLHFSLFGFFFFNLLCLINSFFLCLILSSNSFERLDRYLLWILKDKIFYNHHTNGDSTHLQHHLHYYN